MKRGAVEHPKMIDLASRLDIPRYAAVGLLEVLYHWTSKYAIQGDVGKWPDRVIAAGVGWPEEDAARLIDALVSARWLDEAPAPYRLVIHDIADHADNTWKMALSRAKLGWWYEANNAVATECQQSVNAVGTNRDYDYTRDIRSEPTDSDTTYPHPSVPPTASQPGAPSSNENTSTTSTPSPQPSPQKPVFAPHPKFSKAWPGLCAAIQAAHPKARLPKPGSKGERDAQRVLAQLVKVDGYAEGEVLATLKWVLKDDCADALFWRQQVQSVAQLRHRKNNDTLTKFAKIHAKYERFMKGDGHGVESDEDIERYAREVTKGGR